MSQLHLSISRATDGDMIPSGLLVLLDVGQESALQHEIWDIVDELNMMINVVRQQEEVIQRFSKLAMAILADSRRASKQSKRAFKRRKDDLVTDMSRRRDELERLKQRAESTAQDVCLTSYPDFWFLSKLTRRSYSGRETAQS